jgi:hypothetical protein
VQPESALRESLWKDCHFRFGGSGLPSAEGGTEMKHLLIATIAALLLTACHSTRDAGRPGDEAGVNQGGTTNSPSTIPPVKRNPSLNMRDGWNH